MSATYRYYSLGNPGHLPAGTVTILGWSRTQQAAANRGRTSAVVWASSRQMAARRAADRLGIRRDRLVERVFEDGQWLTVPILRGQR